MLEQKPTTQANKITQKFSGQISYNIQSENPLGGILYIHICKVMYYEQKSQQEIKEYINTKSPSIQLYEEGITYWIDNDSDALHMYLSYEVKVPNQNFDIEIKMLESN